MTDSMNIKFEDEDFDLEKPENLVVQYEGQRSIILRPQQGYAFIDNGISVVDVNQGLFLHRKF